METEDLIKILSILYLGLVICLFGSFQSTKMTENFLLNQIKSVNDDNQEKKVEEEGFLSKITNSLAFKIVEEIADFVIKILEIISIFIRTFF